MSRVKSMVGVYGLLLAMTFLNPQSALAQNATASESEAVELRRRVKELEERLEKLETRQTTDNAGVASTTGATTTDTLPAPPASQDGGILGFFKEVEVSDFVDGYYSYNFNKPLGRTNVLRNFDVLTDQEVGLRSAL